MKLTASLDMRGLQRLHKLQNDARGAGKHVIYLGFFSTATYNTPDNQGVSVAEVARRNNYGTLGKGGFIPPRPFLTTCFYHNENARQLRRLFNIDMKRQYAQTQSPTQAYLMTLNRIAAWAKGRVQVAIANWTTPPNSPLTIARKKSAGPLRDTGHMRQSVAYKIKSK